LGKIKDQRAVPPNGRTVAGCADQWGDEMTTMGEAVRALGMIQDHATIPTLVSALKNTVTRAEAATALARFGAVVIPALLPLLARESDENIRYHVRETLTAVGWRPGRI
jgi:HEAT repeat protein